MDTEIVEAYVNYGWIDEKPMRKFEVEKRFLTWKEREIDVRQHPNWDDKKMQVFHTLNPSQYPHVNSWFSIGRSHWEQCRKVIREII